MSIVDPVPFYTDRDPGFGSLTQRSLDCLKPTESKKARLHGVESGCTTHTQIILMLEAKRLIQNLLIMNS